MNPAVLICPCCREKLGNNWLSVSAYNAGTRRNWVGFVHKYPQHASDRSLPVCGGRFTKEGERA